MGVESIEVSDNGSGIDKSNYETLALKHHTSKLAEFTDLEQGHVTSFGFRGEALNAICELSRDFTVTTKQAHETLGYALSFHRNGK
jgi:DNA mismatch repair protein PMS2